MVTQKFVCTCIVSGSHDLLLLAWLNLFYILFQKSEVILNSYHIYFFKVFEFLLESLDDVALIMFTLSMLSLFLFLFFFISVVTAMVFARVADPDPVVQNQSGSDPKKTRI